MQPTLYGLPSGFRPCRSSGSCSPPCASTGRRTPGRPDTAASPRVLATFSCGTFFSRIAEQRLAGVAVEDVEPSRLAGAEIAVRAPAVDRDVEEHRRVREVVVPDVVVHRLVPPADWPVLTSSATNESVKRFRPARGRSTDRVADDEVDEARCRVDARRRPDRAAAMLPLVAGPRAAADLAVGRARVEAPQLRARVRVVRGDRAARAHLAAGHPDDHLPP